LNSRFWQRSIFWPSDHGSWVFVASPLIIGLVAGGRWRTTSSYLVVAAICGFLVRQPITTAVKALSGRRSRDDLPAALLWAALYASIAFILMLGMHLRGYTYVLLLAIPGMLFFAWYLYLVSRREERGKIQMGLLGTAVLALVAPAGYWIGKGAPEPLGWLLWALAWAQSAASLFCVYLRLRQRTLTASPERQDLLKMAMPAFTFCSVNLLGVLLLGVTGVTAKWLFMAFLPQWLEALYSISHPAIGWKPTKIGYRQLGISTLFTLLFVLMW